MFDKGILFIEGNGNFITKPQNFITEKNRYQNVKYSNVLLKRIMEPRYKHYVKNLTRKTLPFLKSPSEIQNRLFF